MEFDNDSTANPRKRDSTDLSSGNDSIATFHKKQKSISSPASITQNEQSNDTAFDQINGSLNEVEERFSITSAGDLLAQTKSLIGSVNKSQFENFKLKQAVDDEKDKRLELCNDLISELREKCAEKDAKLVEKEKQLIEKEKQLADKARLIELLEAKCVGNESHSAKKAKQLVDKSKLLEKLEADCTKKDRDLASKDKQLQSKLSEICKLQEAYNSKSSQLDEKSKLVEKLQTDCIEKDTQMTATLDRLKNLGKIMHDSNKLADVLWDYGITCLEQKQYIESLVYYDNAIELEKATQNDSENLAGLFANKACCYHYLKQYQECIDAANLALQYDPNRKTALNSRGAAYEYLKQYSNARQDYEKALQLDPTFELARDNLKLLQELINASNSQ